MFFGKETIITCYHRLVVQGEWARWLRQVWDAPEPEGLPQGAALVESLDNASHLSRVLYRLDVRIDEFGAPPCNVELVAQFGRRVAAPGTAGSIESGPAAPPGGWPDVGYRHRDSHATLVMKPFCRGPTRETLDHRHVAPALESAPGMSLCREAPSHLVDQTFHVMDGGLEDDFRGSSAGGNFLAPLKAFSKQTGDGIWCRSFVAKSLEGRGSRRDDARNFGVEAPGGLELRHGSFPSLGG